MADAYTEFLNMTKPEVGASRDTWGTKYNDNFGKLDAWAKTTDAAVKATTAVANAAMPRAGGAFTGAISVPGRIQANPPNAGSVNLSGGSDTNPGFVEFFTKEGTRRGYIGWQGAANKLQFNSENGWGFDFTGAVPTINGKPIFYADNLDLSSRVAKTGDTMSGQLVIKYNYPGLELRANEAGGFPYIDFVNEVSQNVDFQWRLFTYGKAGDAFIFQGPDGNGKFQVNTDGSIWCAQLGDLNTRIEDRASAIADNRLTTARAEYGAKVAKTGDTMTGQLTVSQAGAATVRLTVPGKGDWLVRVLDNNRLQFCDGPATVEYASIGPGGDISTRQFGDLNARIEARGQAWADNAVNRCVTSGRYVYAGDLTTNNRPGSGGFIGAYGGYAMRCDYWTQTIPNGGGACCDWSIRYRYLQLLVNNAGWVTTGAAS